MEVAILIAVVIILGGMLKGFAGFGSSLFIGGILLLFYDPIFVIPMLALMSLAINILLFFEHVHHIKDFKNNFALRWETLLFLVIGSIVGAYFLRYFDPAYIKILFGLVILASVFVIRKHVDKHKHLPTTYGQNSVLGFITGIFSGMINVNAPFAAVYGMYHRYNKHKLMKAVVIFSLIADVIALVIFWLEKFFTPVLEWYLAGILLAVFGYFMGRFFRVKLKHLQFKKWLLVLLVLIAVKVIIDGLALLA